MYQFVAFNMLSTLAGKSTKNIQASIPKIISEMVVPLIEINVLWKQYCNMINYHYSTFV